MNRYLTILMTALLGLTLALATPGALWAKDKEAGPKTHTVTIKGSRFTPATITIKVGDTVVWVNGDDRDHNVTAADGSFNSGNMGPGGNFSMRFTAAGNVGYSCSLHPRMRGTVVVQ